MIRYQYNLQVQPPAPFVYLTLRTPHGEREVADLPALLDTGADKTVIPWNVMELLQLIKTRDIPAIGLDGHRAFLSAFLVQVEMRQLKAVIVEAFASNEEPYVLLGRDVLNHFRIVLDGPNASLEME